MQSEPITYWDLPDRKPLGDVLISREILKSNILVNQILESFPSSVLILNQQRQIVLANSAGLKLFEVESEENLLGKRVGEAFDCIHSSDYNGGCGTTPFCKECGLGRALKITREEGITLEEECRILSRQFETYRFINLGIKTQTIIFSDQEFILVSLVDISSIIRRYELERIFFHDILNTSGAINGLAELLKDEVDQDDKNEIVSAVANASRQLMNEILHQRDLAKAESGKLEITVEEVSINEILKSSYELYNQNKLADGIDFKVKYLDEDAQIKTDSTLLVRSIGNLIKNALEASSKGEEVKVCASNYPDKVVFNVYNQCIIPNEVQLNIFKRSFSTKASKGRGIGTSSVKMLIEDYLKGHVNFTSDEVNKTVFRIHVPIQIEEHD